MEVAKIGRRPGPNVHIIFTPQSRKHWGGGRECWACKLNSICQCRCVHCKEHEGRLMRPGSTFSGGQSGPSRSLDQLFNLTHSEHFRVACSTSLDSFPTEMWLACVGSLKGGEEETGPPYHRVPSYSCRPASTNLCLQAASLSCLHLIACFTFGFIPAKSSVLRQGRDYLGEYHVPC